MKILEFFNPIDIIHLRAYKHLQKNGSWPIDFIPPDVEFTTNWQMMIQSQMADLWVGTNVFMHDIKPSEKPDGTINLDRLLDIAQDFDNKRKKHG